MLASRNTHHEPHDPTEGMTPVPRPQPLRLPEGYFVLQRGPGQYQALHEEEAGLFRAIGNIRPRRNLAAQDVYRLVALAPTPQRSEPPDPGAPTD